MTTLHSRFQDFGEPAYERAGERAGRIHLEGCEGYSKLYCWSALGYYEGALETIKVPGQVEAAEISCQCRATRTVSSSSPGSEPGLTRRE